LKFLIDTSVVSQTRKPRPDPEVAHWWQQSTLSEMGLSVVTVHELRYGIEIAPAGAKRERLQRWMGEFLLPSFADRILPIDLVVADACGRLVARSSRSGHTPELGDALIAATAQVHGLRVATLNRRHFERLGVELVEF